MSYIAPNSTIKLYANVPLDSSYEDTLWFDSLAEQTAYFHGTASVITTLTSQYYQRASRNSLKVQVNIGSAYNCNYLAFRNDSFENKWFYAFVTNVEYVNNEVTELFYELDVMQSFQHDVVWDACYVEREHCYKSQDLVGSNLLAEPVAINDLIYDNYSALHTVTPAWVVAYGDVEYVAHSIVNTQLHKVSNYAGANIIDNTYSGCHLKCFTGSTTGAGGVSSLLQEYLRKPDSIMDIYCVDGSLVPNSTDGTILDSTTSLSFTATGTGYGATFGAYVPLNHKLFTYPYNAFQVGSSNGDTLLLRYEFFKNYTPQFQVQTSIFQPVVEILRPINYEQYYESEFVWTKISELTLPLTGFPKCNWTYDAYGVYVANNWQNLVTGAVKGSANIITGQTLTQQARRANGTYLPSYYNPVTGASGLNRSQLEQRQLYSGLESGFGAVADTLNAMYNAKRQADYSGGSIMSSNADFAHGEMGYYGGRVRITEDNARSIDDFFSRYGYQTNRLKVPNYHSRSIFNYVKTIGCHFSKISSGKACAEDISRMEAIIDNGITFWHNPSLVGNYSRTILEGNV